MAEPAMTEPVLEVAGLSKSFGALKATDAVSLALWPGEIHALIGPNGAGKSTLVAQIAGQLAQDAGEIRLGGREISGLSVAGRARLGLGRTFQVSSLALEFSALRNVMLAVQGRLGSGNCLTAGSFPLMSILPLKVAPSCNETVGLKILPSTSAVSLITIDLVPLRSPVTFPSIAINSALTSALILPCSPIVKFEVCSIEPSTLP